MQRCLVVHVRWIGAAATGLAWGCLAAALSAAPANAAEPWREQVEADWMMQEAVAARAAKTGTPAAPQGVTPASDAAGAVDGVKNGRYGFHTAQEPNPWWQVDLGDSVPLARIVVYNRQDYAPGLRNADALRILGSDDGTSWKTHYDNAGRPFGGAQDARPLIAEFKAGEAKARFVRLQIRSDKPVFFHLDEVEIFGPADPKKNLALKRPADQSSVSPYSTAKAAVPPRPPAPAAYPTRSVIERGRRLAADLKGAGVDTSAAENELEAVSRQLDRLPAGAPPDAQKDLYLKARWAARRLAFANPLMNFREILFVKRFTQKTFPDIATNHMPWVSRPGGDLCIVTLAGPEQAGAVRALLNGRPGPGHVRGMDLHWDGRRIVFGYAISKSGAPAPGWPGRLGHATRLREEPTHLFTIHADGSGLRQLTDDRHWSDLDPTWLPNDDVAFASDRCAYEVQCNQPGHDETFCNLYAVRPDGSRVRRLSATPHGDYHPHSLDDGTIAYTRWEYNEREVWFIHSLWIVRPDGTQADALFKQHLNDPLTVLDVRSIPGVNKYVCIATGHYTIPAGSTTILDPAAGMNSPAGIRVVLPGTTWPQYGAYYTRTDQGWHMTPWALSEKYFLISYSGSKEQTDEKGYGIYLIDVFGAVELICRDPEISSSIPIPLRPRPRPPVLPDRTDPRLDHAVCVVADAGYGVPGVPRQQVRFIRICERMPWPYTPESGGLRYEPEVKNENWSPARVIGTVPVEADGSAHFQAPVDVGVYFQILDENQMELRRMKSFVSFQPGEIRGCTGCHETKSTTAPPPGLTALRRPPSVPAAPPWGSRPMSFLRDVQPVFDRHCLGCHTGLKPAGGLDFFSGLTKDRNRAFETLNRGLVARSNIRDDARVTPPLAFGSHRSKLIDVLRGEAHRTRVTLSAEEWLRLVTWIDLNAPYHAGSLRYRAADSPATR